MSANASSTSNYIHGTEPEERRRLAQLNEILNVSCLNELNLRGGEKILDVGSGLGQFSNAMAQAGGTCNRVVGIERSAVQLAEARLLVQATRQENIEFRQGDAANMPLDSSEWGTFDVAHTRFLLEHVADPQRVVSEMTRAVRPGGRIVLCDDDHELLRLWPEPPGFMTIWQAYIRTYDRLGNDPFVGRRLVSLLHRAGAKAVRNSWIFFGGCAGQAVFPAIVENAANILIGARAAILAAAGIDPSSFDESITAFRRWSERPDAALWYAAAWAEGMKPERAHSDGSTY